MQKQASSVVDIGFRRETIELPEPGPNGKMSVTLRVLSAPEILALLGQFHEEIEPDPKEDREKLTREIAMVISKSRPRLAGIAAEVLLDPPFSFAQREEGKAFWGDLSWSNQVAVFKAALAFAGFSGEVKEGTDAATARRVARFPHEPKGAKVRTRARGGRKTSR